MKRPIEPAMQHLHDDYKAVAELVEKIITERVGEPRAFILLMLPPTMVNACLSVSNLKNKESILPHLSFYLDALRQEPGCENFIFDSQNGERVLKAIQALGIIMLTPGPVPPEVKDGKVVPGNPYSDQGHMNCVRLASETLKEIAPQLFE